MNDNDKNKFAGIMYGVADIFGGKISKDGLRLRFAAMMEYSIDQVSAAAEYIVKYREENYPPVPTVKEFRDAIEKMSGGGLSVKSQAEIQATKIIENLKTHGRTKFPEGLDGVATKLMHSRWNYSRWAAEVIESELVWWVKEFKEAYAAFSESDNIKAIAPPEKMRPLLDRVIKQIV